jgi:RNA polymerase sigma-70 factor (ECF subfamily)
METSFPTKNERFMAQLTAHYHRLYQYVRTLMPRQQDAEDVLQNTLAVMWKKFDDVEPIANFYGWAKRVAYFEVQSYRRQNKRMVTIFDEDVFQQIADRADSMGELLEARGELMDRCIERLNLADVQLLTLRYAAGATVKDVAQRLARPADSLRKSLKRIHQTLWDCINREMAAHDQARIEEDRD